MAGSEEGRGDDREPGQDRGGPGDQGGGFALVGGLAAWRDGNGGEGGSPMNSNSFTGYR